MAFDRFTACTDWTGHAQRPYASFKYLLSPRGRELQCRRYNRHTNAKNPLEILLTSFILNELTVLVDEIASKNI